MRKDIKFLIIESPCQAVTKHPDIHGIMRDHVIVIAHQSRVHVINHKEYPCPPQFEIRKTFINGYLIVALSCLWNLPVAGI